MKLSELVVLNDNAEFEVGGDVQIYRDRITAAKNIEPGDLRGGYIHALSGDGKLLKLTTNGSVVEIEESDDNTDHTAVLRQWLEKLANHVFQGRPQPVATLPPPGSPIHELVEYIGVVGASIR